MTDGECHNILTTTQVGDDIQAQVRFSDCSNLLFQNKQQNIFRSPGPLVYHVRLGLQCRAHPSVLPLRHSTFEVQVLRPLCQRIVVELTAPCGIFRSSAVMGWRMMSRLFFLLF